MTKTWFLAIAAASALAATASAQDLKGGEAQALIKGNTIYIDLPGGPRGKGLTPIYFAADGKVVARFPTGTVKRTWTAKGDTICPKWDDEPNNPCSRYVKNGDTYTSFNVETGQPRGVITKIAAGNPEKL
jgi:hypothetical protein